ncbi:MAG: helix-turn-helix domain-containing protein [Clostridia bacterium]|nr:helix-turn-helix domain-containing protein [Clostridia bacterium]
MSRQTMGEFLAVLRKANGYTQQEVAEKLNISNRTLSSWETDRTTPDILLLPAIAELYNVTVDELVRGARGKSEEVGEFSKQATRSAIKLQYAKLSFKNVLLAGFSVLGAVLFILAACLNLYTAAPTWLVVLIAIIGGGGAVACTILQVCFSIKAKFNGGIVLVEDLTEDKKEYALALKRKSAFFYFINSIPYILFAAILAIVGISVNPQNSEVIYEYNSSLTHITTTLYTHLRTRYIVFGCICAAIGIAFLTAYFVTQNTGLKKLLSEQQLQTRKHNKKLLIKIFAFSAIPLAVAVGVLLMFIFLPSEQETLIKVVESKTEAEWFLKSNKYSYDHYYSAGIYKIVSYSYAEENGLFNCYETVWYDMSLLGIGLFIAIISTTIICACIIYAVKHEKQIYDFQ